MQETTQKDPKTTAHFWKEVIGPYKGADNKKSTIQLLTTFSLFIASWAAMFFAYDVSYYLSLLFAIPAACFVVRLFMIQHDCGHGSYFTSRIARDWIGFCIGVITMTPYEFWRKSHAYHHAHSGDLDFRGFGDINTLTVDEYKALPKFDKLKYRLYRNPIILFVIGPSVHFMIKHRYPVGIPKEWKKVWVGVWATNFVILGIVLLGGFLMGLGHGGFLAGVGKFLALQVPVTVLASSIGVWLFYVQHQYEESYWHWHKDWDYFDAALQGSSHLVLPKPLQWLTASIGLHHVHHLNAMIPNYRLQECMESNEALQTAVKIKMSETFRLMGLTLVDDKQRRMITFREYRKAYKNA